MTATTGRAPLAPEAAAVIAAAVRLRDAHLAVVPTSDGEAILEALTLAGFAVVAVPASTVDEACSYGVRRIQFGNVVARVDDTTGALLGIVNANRTYDAGQAWETAANLLAAHNWALKKEGATDGP